MVDFRPPGIHRLANNNAEYGKLGFGTYEYQTS